MNRIDATRAAVARKFASRPMRAAVAVKIALAIMAANVSFAAAKAVFHKTATLAPIVAPSISSVTPFILQVDDAAAAPRDAAPHRILVADARASNCYKVAVETDEGYGVRGKATRTVCRKAS